MVLSYGDMVLFTAVYAKLKSKIHSASSLFFRPQKIKMKDQKI